jgi:polysaccharide biosynthesis transport protein
MNLTNLNNSESSWSQSNSIGQKPYQGMNVGLPSQGIDWIAMLWRWKWLPILGAIIGISIGGLIWVQLPTQYLARALIQVVNPQSNGIPMVSLDMGDSKVSNRSDDVVIISSKAVMQNAIELGRLDQNSKVLDLKIESLVEWIRHEDHLSVKPGTKESITDIVQIDFTCEDAELSAEVVQAIVAGYERFIGKESQNLNTEVLEKLAKFREELDTKYRQARTEYLKVQKATPLIFNAGEARDPYAEALINLNAKIAENSLKASEIESALEQVVEAQKAGRPLDTVLQTLARISKDQVMSQQKTAVEQMTISGMLDRGTDAEQMRINKLQPLEIMLRVQTENFGDGHPTVTRIQKEIEGVKKGIAEIESREAERRTAMLAELEDYNLKAVPVEQRLASAVGSLNEELQAIKIGNAKLIALAAQNQARSKEMQNAYAELELLKNEMESLNDSSFELKKALERLDMGSGYGGKTMKRLEIPQIGAPAGPSMFKFLGLGAFFGISAFLGLAYLLELADRSYRGPEEVANDLGVPILGHIQLSNLTRKDRKDEKVDLSMVTFHKPKSTAAEAFRGVRTAVYFGNHSGNLKVIQVTSPVPGDGKSTVAANLASTIAQSGRKTLLLDGDMRRPRLAKLLGAREDIGLTNIMAGKMTIEEATQSTSIPNLDILTCGRRPGNPAELLLSDSFFEIIRELREKYDFIIMDTPPLLAVSDPANAAATVDAVILTLRLRRNLKPLASRAAQMLQAVNANLLGVVINGVTGKAGYGYGGYRYDGGGYSSKGNYGGYGYGATYGYGDYYSGSDTPSGTRTRVSNGVAAAIENIEKA